MDNEPRMGPPDASTFDETAAREEIARLKREIMVHRAEALSLREELSGFAQRETVKTEFFANVSHELRTPLTLSLGPLEELMEPDANLTGKEREQYLRTIHHNQLRLLKLINELLDLSKLDAGRMRTSLALTDVAVSVRFYVTTIIPAAESRGVLVELDAPAESVPALVDLDKLETIVLNLLTNALKFTPSGGSIRIALRDEGSEIALTVADSGIGIPADMLDHVFDRFAMGASGAWAGVQGTGIGLSLVKEYVRLHGGTISVESAPGDGATFHVRLPTRRGEEPTSDARSVGSPSSSSPSSSSSSEYKLIDILSGAVSGDDSEDLPRSRPSGEPEALVLVADDLPEMRRFIGGVLSRRYRVVTARDGLEAFEIATELHPDVIVADVMMPIMNGYALCQAIKNDSTELSRTPIVLLSAKADLNEKLEGLEHGADDYLFKPFNARELVARVKNLVKLHRQERELAETFRELAVRDNTIQRELEGARDFQRSMLRALPQLEGVHIEAWYKPAELVGGDVYDIDQLDDGTIRFFLADATGHGVQASLVTMLIKSEYELTKHRLSSPAQALRRLNARMVDLYGPLGLRFSAILGDIHRDRQAVRYATAAHPAPWIVRHGEITELATGGTFVGLISNVEFPEWEAPLQSGDALVTFTDGITEQPDTQGEPFGETRLKNALSEAGEGPVVPTVEERVSAFVGAHPPYDDMTLLRIARIAP